MKRPRSEAEKVKNRAYGIKRVRQAREQAACVSCFQPAVPRQSYCLKCKTKHAVSFQRRYAQKALLQLCRQCNKLAVPNRVLCTTCSKKGRLISQKRRLSDSNFRIEQNAKSRKRSETEIGAFTKMRCHILEHSKHLHAKGKTGTCTMTSQDLYAIYVKQNMRCAISGVPLTHIPCSHFQASPNRIDDTKNYDENTELTALEFNTPAKWTKMTLESCREARTKIISVAEKEKMLESLNKQPTAIHKSESLNGDGEHWRCFVCNRFLLAEYMGPRSKTICKKCLADKHRSSIRAELITLLCSARGNSKVRGQDAAEVVTIDFEFLCALLVKQNFRCAYSRIPLQFPCMGGTEPCFRMSLERMNPTLFYSPENVCLIARGFQSTDNTRKTKYARTGSAAWSKQKFNYVMKWLDDRDQGHNAPTMTFSEYLKGFI